jgi:hypothetical protein
MSNFGSAQKRLVWQSRFARYRTSGLSVARFCEQEQVSSKAFYYWAKRLRTASAAKTSRTDRAMPPRRASPSLAGDLDTQEAVVRFRCKTGMEVLVPADCLPVIRCLAECLAEVGDPCGEAFQEVLVKV